MKKIEETIIEEILKILNKDEVDYECAFYVLSYNILTYFFLKNNYPNRIKNILKRVEKKIKGGLDG